MNIKYNPEELIKNFVGKILDAFNSLTNLEDLNTKMTMIFAEFVGKFTIELEKIYLNGKEGALFCFAENIIKFFSSFISEEAIDNLLEINPNVFEEMMDNGIDLYKEFSKKNSVRCEKEFVKNLFGIFFYFFFFLINLYLGY